jgi:hypothetical protein
MLFFPAFPKQILLPDVLKNIDGTWSWMAGIAILLIGFVSVNKSYRVGLLRRRG